MAGATCEQPLSLGRWDRRPVVNQTYKAAAGALRPTVQQGLTVGHHQSARANTAADKVNSEYDRCHQRDINAPSAVEQHFIEGTVKQIKAVKSKAAPEDKRGGS